MAKVVWQPHAIHELREIIRYINQFDPVAAQGIGTHLVDLGDSLAAFPKRGRPKDGGFREMTTVPPYILRYAVEDGIVTILSIRHGARKPD